MKKTILITGSTDGIGLETAKRCAADGHIVLLHGRSSEKLTKAAQAVGGSTKSYIADLSRADDVASLAQAVAEDHPRLDVLINNAGVLKTANAITKDGLDARFMVNTIAPYVLTRQLLPLMDGKARIVNVSSAAQATVDHRALAGKARLEAMEAYSQSKLAITMWTREMAGKLPEGPVVVAVNPGSLLASKMVKQGFGIAGNDLGIGADILYRAALSDAFSSAGGQYFDNDSGDFAQPHPDALDETKSQQVVATIEAIMTRLGL